MSINNEFNPANFNYQDSSKLSEYIEHINKKNLINKKTLSINNKWLIINQKVLELSEIDSKNELETAIKKLESLRNEVILEIQNSEKEVIALLEVSNQLPNQFSLEQP